MTNVLYEQPREKLAHKGAPALTTTELLQVIIGSGNAKASVTKISKKVAHVLVKSGSSVHPQELLAISGIGKVKAGQILALFELAARFPVLSKGEAYTSAETLKVLYTPLKSEATQTLLYATFDGAQRSISQRRLYMNHQVSPAKQIQKMFADCISDSAVSMLIAIGHIHQSLELNLQELSLVRDIYKTAELVSIPIRLCVFVSKEGEHIIQRGSV